MGNGKSNQPGSYLSATSHTVSMRPLTQHIPSQNSELNAWRRCPRLRDSLRTVRFVHWAQAAELKPRVWPGPGPLFPLPPLNTEDVKNKLIAGENKLHRDTLFTGPLCHEGKVWETGAVSIEVPHDASGPDSTALITSLIKSARRT